MSSPPLLTIAMPARNSASYIKEAIDSVLLERSINIQLFVVDDASNDNTVEIINSISDSRLYLLQNKTQRGISYCHNLILDRCRSPYIAHVDSDDFVVEGGLRKMLTKLVENPNIGMAHCFSFSINDKGEVLNSSLSDNLKDLRSYYSNDFDYRRELMVTGMVANHLRTFRRSVFERAGRFNESLKYAEDFEMAVKIADVSKIGVVPEFLYGHRVYSGNTSPTGMSSALRCYLGNVKVLNRLKKTGEIRFLQDKRYSLYRYALIGLLQLLGVTKFYYWQLYWRGSNGGLLTFLCLWFKNKIRGS